MDAEKLKLSTTTDGKPPREGCEQLGAPAPINPITGQHEAYWVLSAEERAKGFVRPVRRTYRHVGIRPTYPLRDLTDEENRGPDVGYVKYEQYPEGASCIGRFWTQAQLESGCGTETTMSQDIAETYARDPKYYGATFCCRCGKHIRVEEFVWADSPNERVGT